MSVRIGGFILLNLGLWIVPPATVIGASTGDIAYVVAGIVVIAVIVATARFFTING